MEAGSAGREAPYVVMQYGPDSLRSSELVNQGSVTQHFGYDLLAMGGAPQRVADFGGTALTTTYFFGVGSAQPLDMIVSRTSYYYHRDAFRSVTTLTDPSNNVAASYRYDAFGNQLQSQDTVGNPNRWDGLEWDTTTGLIHDGARFYDPVTGRHLTPDPTMGDPGGFANINEAEAFLWTLAPPSGSSTSTLTSDGGNGPTCPPGNNGRGNANGHCGGAGGGSGNPTLAYLGRCGAQATVFVLGVALSALGAILHAFHARGRGGTRYWSRRR